AIIGSQVLILGLPALLLAWYVKLDPVHTFSLRAPRPIHVLAALLLAVSAWPVSTLAYQVQSHFFPMSRSSARMFEQMESLVAGGSIIFVFLALAVAPAICEELLFRGLLTSGLRTRLSTWKTVVAVGFLFGLFHIVLEKLPLTSLM